MYPLDFFDKNSYYLSVGINFPIPPVLFSGRQGACYGVKIYHIYEGGIQSENKSPRKCCLQGFELRDKATQQFTNRLWLVNAIGG